MVPILSLLIQSNQYQASGTDKIQTLVYVSRYATKSHTYGRQEIKVVITIPDPSAANTPKRRTPVTGVSITLVKLILAKTRTISSPKLAQMALLLTQPEIHAPSMKQTQEVIVEGSTILEEASQQPLNVAFAEEEQHQALLKAEMTTIK